MFNCVMILISKVVYIAYKKVYAAYPLTMSITHSLTHTLVKINAGITVVLYGDIGLCIHNCGTRQWFC